MNLRTIIVNNRDCACCHCDAQERARVLAERCGCRISRTHLGVAIAQIEVEREAKK